jgi:hypothetical protein
MKSILKCYIKRYVIKSSCKEVVRDSWVKFNFKLNFNKKKIGKTMQKNYQRLFLYKVSKSFNVLEMSRSTTFV